MMSKALNDLPHHHVVAAIIQQGGRVLCVQKGHHKYSYLANKYEFPGGKMEPGESPQQALMREISEELHLQIDVGSAYLSVEHMYPDFIISLQTFVCTARNAGSLTLTEHVNAQWLFPHELEVLSWAAADVPIVHRLFTHTL